MGLKVPVIYAGNIENQQEMELIFDEESGQQLYNVENVYPKIDDLNVEPCRKVIQDAFEDHIIHAPGMEHVRDMVSGPIVPTPGAVMQCTKLLNEYLGNCMVLDVGGATTDLHSVTEDSDQIARLLVNPEPKAKRTVEGDLGVYVNKMKVIESIGEEKLREELSDIDIDKVLESYVAIPKTEDEIRFVERLTEEAVLRAVERHAGTIRYIYGPSGRNTVAEGKDLTQVQYIVGTGGALTRLPHRVEIMKKILTHNDSGMMLLPGEHAKILVDNDYIMASLGALSMKYKDAAAKLLEKSLGIKFPAEKPGSRGSYKEELANLNKIKRDKELAYLEHLEECKVQGYDVSKSEEEFKNRLVEAGLDYDELLGEVQAKMKAEQEEKEAAKIIDAPMTAKAKEEALKK